MLGKSSSCSLLSYRGASSDSSIPARRQRRPRSSPCGSPATSTAPAWLTTCSSTSAGGGCSSTWLWVRAGLTPTCFPSFLAVSLGNPQVDTVPYRLHCPALVPGHPLASMVWRVGRELYNKRFYCRVRLSWIQVQTFSFTSCRAWASSVACLNTHLCRFLVWDVKPLVQ